MNPNDVAPLLIFFTMIVGAVVVLRGPLGKALARRIEGSKAAPEELTARIVDLEHRLAEAETDRLRLADLEERIDFAERLLATSEARRELR